MYYHGIKMQELNLTFCIEKLQHYGVYLAVY